ncbi:MAG: hypothetical protein ACD_56C00141G0018 [uncultured bacterium]|nr:MAG: hypothetical protein ACD_56C00141G0018 [uncultured bacterium]
MERIKNFFNSKSYNLAIWTLLSFVVLSITFSLGVKVGLHKARYSYQWGANYERNFAGPRSGTMGPENMIRPGIERRPEGPKGFFPGDGDMRNAHGLAGTIVSISMDKIVVKDRDNKENTITITDKTFMKSGRNDFKLEDLKVEDKIIVMGKPNDEGTVVADLIRIFEKNEN